MRSIGADIRIFNASKNKVAEQVKAEIESDNLQIIIDEEQNDRVRHIVTKNKSTCCIQFWWQGIPQIIDFKLFECSNNETRIEIRFGFIKKYWIWFWTVLFFLASLLIISYEFGHTLEITDDTNEVLTNIYLLSTTTICTGIISLVALAFSIKSIGNNYDKFLSVFF